MKRKFIVVLLIALLAGIANLYLIAVNPFGREYVFRMINLFLIVTLIIIIASKVALYRYKFLQTLCGAIVFLLFAMYMLFFTPENAIVLGISLAAIGLVSCAAVYIWVKYKKISPDPPKPEDNIFRTVFGKTKK